MIVDFDLYTGNSFSRFAFVTSTDAPTIGLSTIELWEQQCTMFCVSVSRLGDMYRSEWQSLPRLKLEAASFKDAPLKTIVSQVASQCGFAFECNIATKVTISLEKQSVESRFRWLAVETGNRFHCQDKKIFVEPTIYVDTDFDPKKIEYLGNDRLTYLGEDFWLPLSTIVGGVKVSRVKHSQQGKQRTTILS